MTLDVAAAAEVLRRAYALALAGYPPLPRPRRGGPRRPSPASRPGAGAPPLPVLPRVQASPAPAARPPAPARTAAQLSLGGVR